MLLAANGIFYVLFSGLFNALQVPGCVAESILRLPVELEQWQVIELLCVTFRRRPLPDFCKAVAVVLVRQICRRLLLIVTSVM